MAEPRILTRMDAVEENSATNTEAIATAQQAANSAVDTANAAKTQADKGVAAAATAQAAAEAAQAQADLGVANAATAQAQADKGVADAAAAQATADATAQALEDLVSEGVGVDPASPLAYLHSPSNSRTATIAANTDFTVPEYVVGTHRLSVEVDGLKCAVGTDASTCSYKEVGTAGEASTTIQWLQDVPVEYDIMAVVLG